MIKYKVWSWDFNKDDIEEYDIIPYLYRCIDECEKNINNKEELKDLILKKSQYRFWSRCEWEIIITGWPVQKRQRKMDVYDQIKMNINNIVDLIWYDRFEVQSKKKR